jgi:hypothetical protein
VTFYTAIAYQGNTVRFAAHVHDMSQYIAREKLCGRLYNRYETLMMTLETLQGRFLVPMKHNAGLEFEAGHNKVNLLPFKLEISNIATTLTLWAKDLHLDVSRGVKGDRIVYLATTTQHSSNSHDSRANTGIHDVGSDKKC